MGKTIISITAGLPALPVSGIYRMGATTPVGGINFIAGWVLLLLACTGNKIIILKSGHSPDIIARNILFTDLRFAVNRVLEKVSQREHGKGTHNVP